MSNLSVDNLLGLVRAIFGEIKDRRRNNSSFP
ncbi:MAG: hypothetical protein ACI85I_001718 [Arenicella sp.]|jgi:hypothetical protein